jgi:O-antigen/teichoic acid export membrane protein
MRLVRNTFFLYLAFFTNLLLNFIQLKILSACLPLKNLGVFFTVTAFGEIISLALLLGLPLVFSRYLPKFEAEGNTNKIAGLALFAYCAYILLSLVVSIPIFVLGYRLGYAIYRDPAVARYLAFGVGLQLVSGIVVLTIAGFNGLRKMGSSAILGILYLLLQTVGIFLLRHQLNVGTILRIYLGSLLITTVAALLLFARGLRALPLLSRALIRELLPYWRYAVVLGLLAPLFSYLDRLLVGYFLGMASVSLFVVAVKITSLARTILGTPLEAVIPEISYFHEKGESAVLGRDLTMVIKLLFFLACGLTTFLSVGSRWLILLIATPEYLKVVVPFLIIVAGLPLIAAYAAIPAAMRAVGKISLYLFSDLIYLGCYFTFIFIFIKPFGLVGVALAQLLSLVVVLVFTFVYTAPRHTDIRLGWWFFVRTVFVSFGLGIVVYLLLALLPVPYLVKLLLAAIAIAIGFLGFFRIGIALPAEERKRLVQMLKLHSPLVNWLLALP